MEEIINQVVVELGYIIFNTAIESNTQNNGIVNILPHQLDLNFITEQMTQNIDILIAYEQGRINIATRSNLQAEDLINELSNRLNMHRVGKIEPHPHFIFSVITIESLIENKGE